LNISTLLERVLTDKFSPDPADVGKRVCRLLVLT